MREKIVNPIKTSPISIEITDQSVRIIQTNRVGAIIKSASADMPDLPDPSENTYIEIVSDTIKKAASAGTFPRKYFNPCVLVISGPQIILRRFTMPDMDTAAIKANVLTEMAEYLPGDPVSYQTGYRLVRKTVKEESHPIIELIAAAVPMDLASALTQAAHKAGYQPQRLDIVENARGKLVDTCEIEIEPNKGTVKSYAVLDIYNQRLNMTLYLNGVYYTNRYFSASYATVLQPSDTGTDALVNEVASIIDYIQYRERQSNLECILLLGDDEALPRLRENLKESLDLPVLRTGEWLKLGKENPDNTADIFPYLDAYGAGISASTDLGADLDVKPLKKAGIRERVIFPFVSLFLILIILNAIVIGVPQGRLSSLESTLLSLDGELTAFTVTPSVIQELNQEISTMQTVISEVNGFHIYPQAVEVIPLLYSLDSNESVLTGMTVSDGEINLRGRAQDFNQVADMLNWIKAQPLFDDAFAQNVSASLDRNIAAEFTMTIQLKSGEEE